MGDDQLKIIASNTDNQYTEEQKDAVERELARRASKKLQHDHDKK